MAGKKPAKDIIPADFGAVLADVKNRIQTAQARAVLTVNAELVRLYWDIGRIITQRQRKEGWGAAVIPPLARELHNELPDIKGFSERNIDRMIAFFRAYPEPSDFSPPAVAKLSIPSKVPQPAAQLSESLLWSVPWAHHVILMGAEKRKAVGNDHRGKAQGNGNVLKEREQRLRDGKDKFVDLDQAKKDIRNSSIELL
ncbi:MAG: DUF1016 N-terminal domain-containing protein [bacterium]